MNLDQPKFTTYADLLPHIERMEEFANLFLDTIRDNLSEKKTLGDSAAYRAMRYLEFLGEEAQTVTDLVQRDYPNVDWPFLALAPTFLARGRDMKSKWGVVRIFYKGIPDQVKHIREAREQIQAKGSQALLREDLPG